MTKRSAMVASVRAMVVVMAVAAMMSASAWGQGPSSSLVAGEKAAATAPPVMGEIDELTGLPVDPAADLHDMSIFTIAPARPRTYAPHDLVEIVIRETSRAASTQDLKTSKKFDIKAEVAEFPQLTLNDFLDGVLKATENANPAKLDITSAGKFTGTGDYERSDDLTARVMAQVIEVLPNGNLVLEARTHLQFDAEVSSIMLSGVCMATDVSPAGSVPSSRLFDLKIVKVHEGELKKTTSKGFISRALESIFAF